MHVIQGRQASHGPATVWMTAPRTTACCLATTCLLTCNTQQILSSPHCVARNMEAKSWDACQPGQGRSTGAALLLPEKARAPLQL